MVHVRNNSVDEAHQGPTSDIPPKVRILELFTYTFALLSVVRGSIICGQRSYDLCCGVVILVQQAKHGPVKPVHFVSLTQLTNESTASFNKIYDRIEGL